MDTSLSNFEYLENLKAAFNFWLDGSYNEILQLELVLVSALDADCTKIYGIKSFCHYFSTLKFEPDLIHRLAAFKEQGKPVFNESFLNYLQRLSFSFDVKAVSEAQAVDVGQAVLCIRGPKIELKIVENALMNFISGKSETNFELKTSNKSFKDIAIKEICRAGNLL